MALSGGASDHLQTFVSQAIDYSGCSPLVLLGGTVSMVCLFMWLRANTGLRSLVFVGTSKSIVAFGFSEDGRLSQIGSPVTPGGSPTWLFPRSSSLFAVDEGAKGGVSAFDIDVSSASRTPLQVIDKVQEPLAPAGPCHCCTDATGRWLLASNYGHGSICVYQIKPSGAVGDVVDSRCFGASSHAHCAVFAPGNKHAFICDLGLDGVHQFDFDDRTGKLTENAKEPFSHSSSGSGPRHICFHPRGLAVYTINEKDSTVDTFTYLPDQGLLRREQTLSALPSNFHGVSYCAEIKVSRDGRHLYGSNRATEPAASSVVVYQIDESNPTSISPVCWVTDHISWPRGMSLSPTEGHLIVANQQGKYGDTISVFDRDAETGKLSLSKQQPPFACAGGPQCIDWCHVGRI